MQRRVGRVLFWWVIGLVAGAFMLAVAGEETASTAAKQRLLNWHEWIGLSSLVVLIFLLRSITWTCIPESASCLDGCPGFE